MTAPAQSSSQAQAAALVAAYIAAQATLRANALTMLQRMWAGLSSWRDADALAFARRAVPVVHGAQQATASLTSTYLAQSVSAQTGAPFTPPVITAADFTGNAVRTGVDPVDVYQRPFTQIWTDLSQGKSLPDAVSSAENRLVSLASTDIQLAKTHAAVATLDQHEHITGYRRVLTGAHSCALCIVASTQRYHKRDLMPIHPGCDCAVAPIVGEADPGQVIDEDALAGAHAAIRERFGTVNWGAREIGRELRSNGKPLLYRDVLVSHEHGEIGPVLAVRGQNFTGPADIPGGH